VDSQEKAIDAVRWHGAWGYWQIKIYNSMTQFMLGWVITSSVGSKRSHTNRVREALGDSADTPRFVETLPRRGYRFIGPVERPEHAPRRSRLTGDLKL